jgi:GNAT superfamily N-acetyltransferase
MSSSCHAATGAVFCDDARMATDTAVRDATPADDDGIVAVAAAHGFTGADTGLDATYRRFIAEHGRLVVALADGGVVGFGGAIDADGVRLVSDLFVMDQHQGRGLGAAMLRALVADAPHRMTFSSSHRRAVPGYRRMGMEPSWRLRYWLGRATGASGGASGHKVVEVARADWRGDRQDLADHWSAGCGRLMHLVEADRVVGWSIAVRTDLDAATWTVTRLVTELPHDAAMRSVLSTLPEGDSVLVSSPERSSAGTMLNGLRFDEIDHDIFCATAGIDVPASVAALHPGLG